MSLDIGNLLNNLSNLSIDNNFFFNFENFIGLRLDCVLNDYFLHYCRDLNDFFDGFSHGYEFLYNSIDWNRNLNRNNDLFLNFNDMRHFNSVVDYFLYRNISWNFSDDFNNFFD